MSMAMISRQPVYDNKAKVVAYELLFASCDIENALADADNVDANTNDDHSSSSVILHAFSDIGFQKVLNGKKCYIMITPNMLEKGLHDLLPKDKVIIEISNTDFDDDKLVSAVTLLKEHGFTLALDDFTFKDNLMPMLEHVDVVKIDTLNESIQVIQEKVDKLKDTKVEILAKRIETHDVFEACKEVGIHFFQGYFLSKPNIIKEKTVTPNRLVTMKLLSELQDEDIDIFMIEKSLCQDASLSYKLLRVINSAAYGMPRTVKSLREAVIRMGTDRIRDWATLLTMSNIEDKPHDLMITTMVRAKMCELLAEELKQEKPNVYFTTGLFSTIDALLDRELSDVLNDLPIAQNITAALLEYEGTIGLVLKNTISYERGTWDEIDYSTLSEDTYCKAYLNGIEWADEAFRSLVN